MRLSMRRVVALGVVTCIVAISAPAMAARGDARAERERVRREKAEVAAALDVLRANGTEVERALDALDARVAQEEAALQSAEQAVSVATKQADDAARRESETAAEIARLQDAMRDAAVSEFMTGGSTGELETLLDAEDADLRVVVSMRVLQDSVTNAAEDVADQLGAAREDFAEARRVAEDARAAAETARAAANERVRAVRGAQEQQASFAADLDRRIDARLVEAASLEALDRNLAAQLVREQQALARRASGIRRSPVASSTGRGSIPLRTVRGITVHADIADELEALLDAADADGFSFGGGGYRDPSQQQRLREQNCPDPESSPSTSCRPPTARPGSSMHEQGLAIDFTSGGRLISSRSSPAFQWLASNAARFGLYNFPQEPWHWSTNGN